MPIYTGRTSCRQVKIQQQKLLPGKKHDDIINNLHGKNSQIMTARFFYYYHQHIVIVFFY